MSTVTLEVPAKFWDDHDERGCVNHSGTGYELKRTKRLVTVALHPRDAYDLMTDAEFYSDNGDSGQDPGLRRSASATLDRIVVNYEVDEMMAWRTAGTCEVEGWCPTCGYDR